MINSESIAKIAPALLQAQKKIGSAVKGSTNPFFHSSYADLGSVMEACKDALNDNGITVLQPVGTLENEVYVETILLHESGEFIADRMNINAKSESDPQAQGSAITYARRYGLQSICFIPSEDDDGEKSMIRASKPVVKEEPKTVQQVKNESWLAADEEQRFTCEECGQPIEYHGNFTPKQQADFSKVAYKKVLCWKDQEKRRLAQ